MKEEMIGKANLKLGYIYEKVRAMNKYSEPKTYAGKYLYRKSKEKNEISSINWLLKIVIEEISNQKNRREQLENKASYILAFLGLLIGVIINADVLKKMEKCNLYIVYIVIIVFFMGVIFATCALLVRNYMTIDLIHTNRYFQMAIDDEFLYKTVLLETYVECLRENEKINKIKGFCLTCAIISVIICLLFGVYVYLLGG